MAATVLLQNRQFVRLVDHGCERPHQSSSCDPKIGIDQDSDTASDTDPIDSRQTTRENTATTSISDDGQYQDKHEAKAATLDMTEQLVPNLDDVHELAPIDELTRILEDGDTPVPSEDTSQTGNETITEKVTGGNSLDVTDSSRVAEMLGTEADPPIVTGIDPSAADLVPAIPIQTTAATNNSILAPAAPSTDVIHSAIPTALIKTNTTSTSAASDPYRNARCVRPGTSSTCALYMYPSSRSKIPVEYDGHFKEVTRILHRIIESDYGTRSFCDYILYQLLLCGSSTDKARPAVVVVCDEEPAPRIKKVLTQPNVLEQCNLYAPTKQSTLFRFWKKPVDVQDTLDRPRLPIYFYIGKPSVSLYHPSINNGADHSLMAATMCGAEVYNDRGDHATISCIIRIGSKLYGLTSAHCFHEGGLQQDTIYLEEEDSAFCQMDCTIRVTNRKIKSDVEFLVPNSSDRETADLDWAIVELTSSDLMKENTFITPSRQQRVVGGVVQQHPRIEKSILVVFSTTQTRTGTLLVETTYRGSPGRALTDIWSIEMDNGQELEKGHSGSLVVDAVTGRSYGYVVAIDIFGKVQVMPLVSVFNQILAITKADTVCLAETSDIVEIGNTSAKAENDPVELRGPLANTKDIPADTQSTRRNIEDIQPSNAKPLQDYNLQDQMAKLIEQMNELRARQSRLENQNAALRNELQTLKFQPQTSYNNQVLAYTPPSSYSRSSSYTSSNIGFPAHHAYPADSLFQGGQPQIPGPPSSFGLVRPYPSSNTVSTMQSTYSQYPHQVQAPAQVHQYGQTQLVTPPSSMGPLSGSTLSTINPSQPAYPQYVQAPIQIGQYGFSQLSTPQITPRTTPRNSASSTATNVAQYPHRYPVKPGNMHNQGLSFPQNYEPQFQQYSKGILPPNEYTLPKPSPKLQAQKIVHVQDSTIQSLDLASNSEVNKTNSDIPATVVADPSFHPELYTIAATSLPRPVTRGKRASDKSDSTLVPDSPVLDIDSYLPHGVEPQEHATVNSVQDHAAEPAEGGGSAPDSLPITKISSNNSVLSHDSTYGSHAPTGTVNSGESDAGVLVQYAAAGDDELAVLQEVLQRYRELAVTRMDNVARTSSETNEARGNGDRRVLQMIDKLDKDIDDIEEELSRHRRADGSKAPLEASLQQEGSQGIANVMKSPHLNPDSERLGAHEDGDGEEEGQKRETTEGHDQRSRIVLTTRKLRNRTNSMKQIIPPERMQEDRKNEAKFKKLIGQASSSKATDRPLSALIPVIDPRAFQNKSDNASRPEQDIEGSLVDNPTSVSTNINAKIELAKASTADYLTSRDFAQKFTLSAQQDSAHEARSKISNEYLDEFLEWMEDSKEKPQRGAWTKAEDELLSSLVVGTTNIDSEFSNINWASIAACIPGRSAKQCRRRYVYCLILPLTSKDTQEDRKKEPQYSKLHDSSRPDSLDGSHKEDSGPPTTCTHCGTQRTPLWRKDHEGLPLCNACGLFLKLHGVVRPLSLKSEAIRKTNRGSASASTVTTAVEEEMEREPRIGEGLEYELLTPLL